MDKNTNSLDTVKQVEASVPQTKTKGKESKRQDKVKEKQTEEVEGFRAGAYAPKVSIVTVNDPEALHTYLIDTDLAAQMSRHLVQPFMQNAARMQQPVNQVQATRLFERGAYFAMAKKLLATARPEQVTNISISSKIMKTKARLPDCLIQLYENFGQFTFNGSKFHPRHVELKVYDCFVKAAFQPGNNGLPNAPQFYQTTYVDLRSNWYAAVSDFLFETFENYIDNFDPVMVNMGGLQVSFRPWIPGIFTDNYADFLTGLGVYAANAPAIAVARALAFIEANPAIDQLNPPAQFIQLLALCGIWTTNFNAGQVSEVIDDMIYALQNSLSMTLNSTYKMVEYDRPGPNGSSAQLSDTKNATITMPFETSTSTYINAVMIQGTTSRVKFDNHQIMVLTSGMTQRQALMQYAMNATVE